MIWFLAPLIVWAAVTESKTTSPPDQSMTGMQMGGMPMDEHHESPVPSGHSGAGTGWEPASVPSHDGMVMRGGWGLLAHRVIFLRYNEHGRPGGGGQAEWGHW